MDDEYEEPEETDAELFAGWIRLLSTNEVVKWTSDHMSQEEPYAFNWIDVNVPEFEEAHHFNWTVTIQSPDDPEFANEDLLIFSLAHDIQAVQDLKLPDHPPLARPAWSPRAVSKLLNDYATSCGRPDVMFAWDADAGPSPFVSMLKERLEEMDNPDNRILMHESEDGVKVYVHPEVAAMLGDGEVDMMKSVKELLENEDELA